MGKPQKGKKRRNPIDKENSSHLGTLTASDRCEIISVKFRPHHLLFSIPFGYLLRNQMLYNNIITSLFFFYLLCPPPPTPNHHPYPDCRYSTTPLTKTPTHPIHARSQPTFLNKKRAWQITIFGGVHYGPLHDWLLSAADATALELVLE